METYIFLGLVGLVRLATGVALLRLASQKNLPNLRWLGWGFIITVIDIPFTVQPYVPYVDKVFSYVVYLCFALFIAQTFYRDRRSPLLPFWSVFTLLYLAMFWTTANFMTDATGIDFPQHIFTARPSNESVPMGGWEAADSLIYGVLQMAIWLWHAIAGFQASRIVARDEHVEDWIKSRYRLIVAYSVMQSLIGVIMMVRFFVSPVIIMLSALLVTITTGMQYLVWVMPEGFRKWLNRNQQTRTRGQILIIFESLSSAMSEGTGLPKLVASFSIRKIIGQKINSEDSNKVEEYAIALGYNEWSEIINSPELYNLIENSPATAGTSEIIARTNQALTEQQSLFTMQAK